MVYWPVAGIVVLAQRFSRYTLGVPRNLQLMSRFKFISLKFIP